MKIISLLLVLTNLILLSSTIAEDANFPPQQPTSIILPEVEPKNI